MRCLLFGATGAAGTGVLEACLADPKVEEIVVVTRRPTGQRVRELICSDFADLSPLREQFNDVDTCFYCLGVSQIQEPDPDRYRTITHDYALEAANLLREMSPNSTFHFLSGAGAGVDSRWMWARIKGETERDLQALGSPAVTCWRPGYIHPLHERAEISLPERITRLLYPLFKGFRGLSVRADQIGFAMLEAQGVGLRDGTLDNRAIRALADKYLERLKRPPESRTIRE